MEAQKRKEVNRMILMKEMYSYTLMEVLRIVNPQLDKSASGIPWNYDTDAMLDGLVADKVGWNPTAEQLADVKVLFSSYLLPKCWNMYVEVCSKEDTKGLVFIGEVLAWLNSTQEKYSMLLQYYRTHKDKLMDDVITSSDSTATTNDTPQDEGNNWGDDMHVSSVGKNHTESKTAGGASYMQQLNSIQRSYRNLYSMWLADFIAEFRVGGNFNNE